MNELSWLQKHEKLILGTLLLAVVLFGANRWIDHEADVTKTEAAVAMAKVKSDADVSAANAVAAKQAEQQYQQMVQTLTAQNQALVSAVATRNSATQKQQQADFTLAGPVLSLRWAMLAKLDAAAVKAVGTEFSVTTAAAQQTVAQLELVPTLQQNLKDETDIVANKDKQLSAQAGVVDSLNKQVSGLNIQLTDSGKACKLEIAATKAEARKGKRGWFVAGFVLGVATHFIKGF